MTWTNATPETIQADLTAMFKALDRPEYQPNTLIMPESVAIMILALQIFGERPNRSNRHKFRRAKFIARNRLSGLTNYYDTFYNQPHTQNTKERT